MNSSSSDPRALPPDALGPTIEPRTLGFATTESLEPLHEVIGQERALAALELGLSIRQGGYNIYASGVSGIDKKGLLRRLLEARARGEPTPDDWVYVYNFVEPDCPLALRLPGGHGSQLKQALERILDRLHHDLPEALKAKDFSAERDRLGRTFGKRGEQLFTELQDHARNLGLSVQRQPNGMLNIVPIKDGRAMTPEEFEQLDEAARAELQRRQEELGEHIVRVIAGQQELMRELHSAVEEIVRGFARRILDPSFAQTKHDFPSEPVNAWLDAVREHLIKNLDRLNDQQPQAENAPVRAEHRDRWLECRVNVVADHARTTGAPLLLELAPSYKNLFGTIEHDVNLLGRVTTDFTRVKAGSLLRASGGYLIIDMEDALTEALVWKQLKRVLRSGLLLTEAYDPLSLFTAGSLRPNPIPIDTKVVAVGSPELFFLLQEADHDFAELFKVHADFGAETTRDEKSHSEYARFIARQVHDERLRHFDAPAVAEIIRFGARRAEHRNKLSVDLDAVADLVREADHHARVEQAPLVRENHVRQALDHRIYRRERIAARIRELILEGMLRVALEGRIVGQLNGLPVLYVGDQGFGWPSRITASVGVGHEGVLNIDREARLTGKIFDKGMLILEGYLRHRYAANHPLALSASITFEQSYGWVEGDSASSAELYCLLSALAGTPLRQDVAVTGSVDQHGRVQVVGAINEKVEGFFDVCRLKGLSGSQGVCIPRGNMANLVLRHDVVQAVAAGLFHVWAVDTIDEGIELLTGISAGDLETHETFHYRVETRLQEILSRIEREPPRGTIVRAITTTSSSEHPSTPPRLPGDEAEKL